MRNGRWCTNDKVEEIEVEIDEDDAEEDGEASLEENEEKLPWNDLQDEEVVIILIP